MEQILKLSDIHTYYGESHALQGVSLGMEEGSVTALLGRNGMGKTTTVHSIIGITPPLKGFIFFKGRDITQLQSYQIAREGIALIPQGRRIFSSLSVKENLTVAAIQKGSGAEWTLGKIYSLFPILEQRSNVKGNLLSGGEQQMLAIGRGLMTNPKLLLMDEPSEGLAPLVIKDLINVIKQLHQTGLSILIVEQNLQMALAVASNVYILNKGNVVYESSPSELKKNEKILNTYLGVESQ